MPWAKRAEVISFVVSNTFLYLNFFSEIMLKIPEQKPIVVNASLFKRFFAFVFDLLVVDFVIVSPFRSILQNMFPKSGFLHAYSFLSNNPQIISMLYLVVVAITALGLAYFVILERALGQTPGKMLFSLYIVDGGSGSRWQYILRSLFLIPIFPFVILWIVDPVFLLFSKEHQRLTEYLSKTQVVEKIYW
jgi:uncharacterized RDD family membrane protein YckC